MTRKIAYIVAVALVACLALGGPALAGPCQDKVKQADELFAKRGEADNAGQAVALYEAAQAADPACQEALWKEVRALYWVGNHGPADAKEATFERAVQLAKKAVELNPKSIDAHYWLGVIYGVYGSAKGVTKSLSLVDPIKEEMKTVIAMNPNYDDGGADRVLGRLYFKLPGLFGGDNDKSMAYLEQAVKKGPRRYLNHIYLAEVYIDEGKKDQAKVLLNEVLAGPPQEGFEAEYAIDWKPQAKKLLDDM